MKTKNIFRAVLPMMTAALVMTACSSDDSTNEAPQPTSAMTIPYTVTVNSGDATRATVESDNKTLLFAAGDKLYVHGEESSYNLRGILSIQTGAGTTGPATFSGSLEYLPLDEGTPWPETPPSATFPLTAFLVSAQMTEGVEFTKSGNGAVELSYPTMAYSSDVATAVQKYSELTGNSDYGTQSFTLEQKTAFLNFVITFEDGTTSGTTLNAVVTRGTGLVQCSANVKTETVGGKVVARFVLPVPGFDIKDATVKMGDKDALIITSSSLTLGGRVYNISRTQKAVRTLASVTASDIGKIVGANGHIYDTAAEANAASKAVAMIAYVDGTGGLAITLNDLGSERYDEAGTSCTSLTAVSGGSWRLPSKDDWQSILSTDGLGTMLAAAGGTALGTYYWTSTVPEDETSITHAYRLNLSGTFFELDTKEGYNGVRAVLAF